MWKPRPPTARPSSSIRRSLGPGTLWAIFCKTASVASRRPRPPTARPSSSIRRTLRPGTTWASSARPPRSLRGGRGRLPQGHRVSMPALRLALGQPGQPSAKPPRSLRGGRGRLPQGHRARSGVRSALDQPGYLLQDRLGRFEEAEAAYRKAIELDPAYARPWVNAGRSSARPPRSLRGGRGRLPQGHRAIGDAAWNASNRSVARGGGGHRKAIERIALCSDLHLGRFEEAEAAYRKAIELDPASSLAWTGLVIFEVAAFEDVEAACR